MDGVPFPRPNLDLLHPQYGFHPFLPPAELCFVVNIPKRLEGQSAFTNVIKAAASGLAQSVQGMSLVEGKDLGIRISEPLRHKQRQTH